MYKQKNLHCIIRTNNIIILYFLCFFFLILNVIRCSVVIPAPQNDPENNFFFQINQKYQIKSNEQKPKTENKHLSELNKRTIEQN